MQSHLYSFESESRRPELPPQFEGEDTNSLPHWSNTRQSSLRTTYQYHKCIEDIQVSVHVGTPQDGTWLLDATIEVDPRGRGFLPKIADGYETRPEAELAAIRLLSNLNSETMVRQFIIGQCQYGYNGDHSTVKKISNALKQTPSQP